ncbi:hypothetical protein TanjilG_11057 [Lupinus angustifolius]|uniref:RRM domain-containing protein n=1 Tax=Lupinus angustifolius TaxID=3871 RepID=A0A1J7HA49_LUPAN|nr:hypothetical protein TanjilG_11057 [Lupinus angustifolius]
MWKFISNWGLVGDLFIPQKRDKRGRRFGFVSFKKVEDWSKFKLQLSNIWIGLYKISINTPRFQRQGLKSWVNNMPFSVIPEVEKGVAILGRGGSIPIGNASHWKQALLNEAQSIPSSSRDLGEGLLEFKVKPKFIDKLQKAVLGELVRVEDIFNVQALLAKEGFLSSKATHVGSLGLFVKLDAGTRDMARLDSGGGYCHSRFISRKNQMAEVPGVSDLESWQDRNSCWGKHKLMDVIDDDVVESFVNENNWVGDSVPIPTPNLKGFVDSVPLPGLSQNDDCVAPVSDDLRVEELGYGRVDGLIPKEVTVASLSVAKSVGVGPKSCVQSLRKSKPKSKGSKVQSDGGSPLGLPSCIPASMEGKNSKVFGKSLFEVGSTSKVNAIVCGKEGVLDCREVVSVSNAGVSHKGKLKPLFDAHRPLSQRIQAKRKKVHPPLALKALPSRKKNLQVSTMGKKVVVLQDGSCESLDSSISNSINDSHVRSVNRLHLKEGKNVARKL